MFSRKNKTTQEQQNQEQRSESARNRGQSEGRLDGAGSSQSSLSKQLNNSNESNNRSADRLLGANHTTIDLIDEIALNMNDRTQHDHDDDLNADESDSFLKRTNGNKGKIMDKNSRQRLNKRDNNNSKTATLARAETLDEDNASTPVKSINNPFTSKNHANNDNFVNYNSKQQIAGSNQSIISEKQQQQSCSCSMFCRMLVNKSPILIPLLILSCMAAIYCIPFVDVQPRVPKRLPNIPFNYGEGALRASDASQFKAERLFYNQIHGAESIALDSNGNIFMAIEGGFILYAHVNASSIPNKSLSAAYQAYTTAAEQSQNKQQLDNTNSNQKLMIDGNAAATANAILNNYLISARSFQLAPLVNPRLFKIAELNPIKQMTMEQRRREGLSDFSPESSWRRECQLDELVYGRQLWSTQDPNPNQPTEHPTESKQSALIQSNNVQVLDESRTNGNYVNNQQPKFYSRVVMSRCSKPLGIRLSPDENYLYVIDTLTGFYKIHLRVAERPNSSQRLVTKLIDFKHPKHHLLPVTFLDLAAGQVVKSPSSPAQSTPVANGVRNIRQINYATSDPSHNDDEMLMSAPAMKVKAYLNTSLMAVDDLVIDYGSGTRGGDMIYMSVASQKWIAVGFVYDYLEGRPSGAILRFDTGANQLSVLSPHHISHVRTSMSGQQLYNEDQTLFQWFNEDENDNHNNNYYHLNSINNDQSSLHGPPITTMATYVDRNNDYVTTTSTMNDTINWQYHPFGAPRLDENDIFDDRPLHFPNGLELTDDRQALLIADTANKRIIKHFIRGPRKGTSDLWAWVPNFPDNIRRGYEKSRETYWVAGCGEDTTDKIDMMVWLNSWPRVRKFLLKSIYLFGWVVESFGTNLSKSTRIRDIGYAIRTGHSLCESMCTGMMILQYDSNGKLLRSIYGKEFPQDLSYFSQVNEVIDKQTNQHYLYLSSPGYNYVTKLYLPQTQMMK